MQFSGSLSHDNASETCMGSHDKQLRLKQIEAWAYPEAQSKELGSVTLLIEGRHALHGVGHHGHSP